MFGKTLTPGRQLYKSRCGGTLPASSIFGSSSSKSENPQICNLSTYASLYTLDLSVSSVPIHQALGSENRFFSYS